MKFDVHVPYQHMRREPCVLSLLAKYGKTLIHFLTCSFHCCRYQPRGNEREEVQRAGSSETLVHGVSEGLFTHTYNTLMEGRQTVKGCVLISKA